MYLHTLQRNEITSPQGNAARQGIATVIGGVTYSLFFLSLRIRRYNVLVENITCGCCNEICATDKTEAYVHTDGTPHKDLEIYYRTVHIQHLCNM